MIRFAAQRLNQYAYKNAKNTIQINGILVVYIHFIYLLFSRCGYIALVSGYSFASNLMRPKCIQLNKYYLQYIFFWKIMRRRLVLLMECQAKNGFKLCQSICTASFLHLTSLVLVLRVRMTEQIDY